MKKGSFVSYQLAEAVLLLYSFLKENRSMDEFQVIQAKHLELKTDYYYHNLVKQIMLLRLDFSSLF